MGSTYVSEVKAVRLSNVPGLEGCVAVFERSCESNVYPHRPRLRPSYIGTAWGALDYAAKCGYYADDGSTRGAGGADISAEIYLGWWHEALRTAHAAPIGWTVPQSKFLKLIAQHHERYPAVNAWWALNPLKTPVQDTDPMHDERITLDSLCLKNMLCLMELCLDRGGMHAYWTHLHPSYVSASEGPVASSTDLLRWNDRSEDASCLPEGTAVLMIDSGYSVRPRLYQRDTGIVSVGSERSLYAHWAKRVTADGIHGYAQAASEWRAFRDIASSRGFEEFGVQRVKSSEISVTVTRKAADQTLPSWLESSFQTLKPGESVSLHGETACRATETFSHSDIYDSFEVRIDGEHRRGHTGEAKALIDRLLA
jgi:hypothetical protein